MACGGTPTLEVTTGKVRSLSLILDTLLVAEDLMRAQRLTNDCS
jgi:hypothetical protein